MAGTLIIRASSFIFGIVYIGCLLTSCVAKNKDTKLGPVIGIDLGTTYSRVGVIQNGHVEIIANDQGNRITPSWVAFTDNERLIGEAAKNHSAVNTENTISGVKKLIGRKFEDKEVQQDMKLVPYKIVNRDGKPFIEVQIKGREPKVFSPEEISAMLLRKMKETAEAYLGKEIKDAVVTIPAYFNDAQRKATKEAATIAGINVVSIIDEPTAVAIAYGLDEKCIEKNILVFDLGGGKLDVTIFDLFRGLFEVLATNGNTQLGGEYFDQRIMEYFIKLIKSKHGKDISKDSRAINKLRRECERAKIALSTQQEVRVEIKDLFDGMDFSEPLTRELFEVLNIDLFRKTIGLVKKAMEDVGLEKKQIDEIVLVGGSTKIPKIQQLLKDYFDGKELNVSSNYDEAVVYGAAIQAGILSDEGDDEIKDLSIWPVAPFSLGIETFGGVMTELIPSGSFFPVKRSQVFTTHHDQQTTVSIKVYEWDECRTWLSGKFYLTGIAPAPRGTPEIEITVIYSDSLQIKAEDKASGKFENITLARRFLFSEAERVVKEGDEFALEDIHFKERINARNKLEECVENMRNQINDNDNYNLGDMLESDAKESIETTTKNVRQWMEENQNAQKECSTDDALVVEHENWSFHEFVTIG